MPGQGASASPAPAGQAGPLAPAADGPAGQGAAPDALSPADVTADAPVAPKGAGFTNSKVPAYLAFGVAGLGLVAGTAFGIASLAAKGDYQDTPTYRKAEAVEDRAMMADIGFATFLIAGITGAVFYLNEGAAAASAPSAARRPAPARTGFRLEPTVTPRTQGASLTLRF
ncbi:MAG TPA: hypothetical protein VFS00_28620 [Polyangiaceae bacterium]|nr:hypothetical protein [Polyangiaceae bacterium]